MFVRVLTPLPNLSFFNHIPRYEQYFSHFYYALESILSCDVLLHKIYAKREHESCRVVLKKSLF
jgi:hypothetical protein